MVFLCCFGGLSTEDMTTPIKINYTPTPKHKFDLQHSQFLSVKSPLTQSGTQISQQALKAKTWMHPWRFCRLGLFQATLVWDHLGEVFSALNIFSLLLCVFLYVKVRTGQDYAGSKAKP